MLDLVPYELRGKKRRRCKKRDYVSGSDVQEKKKENLRVASREVEKPRKRNQEKSNTKEAAWPEGLEEAIRALVTI